MGAEYQIALGRGLGGQDRLADGLRRRNGLSQLIQQISVRFDSDGTVEGGGEGAGDFAVAGPGIDEHLPHGQIVHDLLQPTLCVPFLVGMIQEDLKGLFVGFALGIKDTNVFLVGHQFILPFIQIIL
jgi:hypothetical protein